MNKVFRLFLSVLFIMTSFNTGEDDLEVVRINYSKAISDKELCKAMITSLVKTKNNSPTHLAYLGSMQTVWENHVINPISKLSSFKEGKKYIENAVAKEPDNIEIRFIRLSIQKNVPAFLGYKTNIKKDTEFIKKHYDLIESTTLKKNMEKFLNE